MPEDFGDKLLRKARGREFTRGDAMAWLSENKDATNDALSRLLREKKIRITGRNDSILFYRAAR